MKNILIPIFLFAFSIGYAQSLPIDFEASIGTADFIDFDGGTASVIDNPQAGGINTSAKVAQIVRNGGAIWAGSKIDLAANLDFTTLNSISMKVFSTAPIGTVVKFKLEGNGQTERDVLTTVSSEWETLTWDFTGEPTDFYSIVFMFDFGNVGDGSANSTFLFDDVEQLFGGTQLDLPVDFEGTGVNYTMTDFGGNVSSLLNDPTAPNNKVVQVIKTNMAALWAGTTIGTAGGFATNIPLTLSDSKMTARVWSPEAGTPIRLKVEDSKDPTHTCETQTNTTLNGEWEILEFDFAKEAPGTAQLSVGLSMGWVYNKASIFFNFGTEGMVAGEKTYYFDDVNFGSSSVGTLDHKSMGLKVFPNPSSDQWTVYTENSSILSIEVFDLRGSLMLTLQPDSDAVAIDGASLVKGCYVSKIVTAEGTRVVRLLKK